MTAMQEKGIEATEEQFKEFINKNQKNIRSLEEHSIALGWEMINSMLDSKK